MMIIIIIIIIVNFNYYYYYDVATASAARLVRGELWNQSCVLQSLVYGDGREMCLLIAVVCLSVYFR